jgi:hypothetical protein
MRLYCKKTYVLEHYHSAPEKVIIKGNIYQAKKESITTPCATSPATPDYVATYNVIQVATYDGRTISFSQEPKSKQYKYYKDYFFTESEIRKKKIERLNNPFNKLLKLFK